MSAHPCLHFLEEISGVVFAFRPRCYYDGLWLRSSEYLFAEEIGGSEDDTEDDDVDVAG